ISMRGGDVVFKPYDPGYKPDEHELIYVELAQQQTIAEQIRQFSQVQQAELFHESDQIVDHLRFYAIVVSANARRRAVFFRTYSPKKELTRRAGFAALFSTTKLIPRYFFLTIRSTVLTGTVTCSFAVFHRSSGFSNISMSCVRRQTKL